MKTKYGNNENCRKNIHENPQEHIEIWCLQNRKHSYRHLQLEKIVDHVHQVPCLSGNGEGAEQKEEP